MTTLETDYLIVGAGPAGASLACFLASHGLQGILISAATGTASTPRAHITNMATQECFRDIGLDAEMRQLASDDTFMQHNRWCYTLAGEEFGRMYSWGHDPARMGDYIAASPCRPMDLPQTLLEPVLVRRATAAGWTVRFQTALTAFTDTPDAPPYRYTAEVVDRVTGAVYHIRCRVLLGADGARSQVVRQLGLPLRRGPGQGQAVNVLLRADLGHLFGPDSGRRGNLHWLLQPDADDALVPAYGWMGVVRMVRPWTEWLFILLPRPDAEADAKADPAVPPPPTPEQCRVRISQLLGDDTPVEVLDVARWSIHETVAETYAVDDVYLLGDAVHRHPPMNGLGSNTCVQDAFNLAWKLAYVARGWAAPALLASYSAERQPVGAAVVARANQGLRDHQPVWAALGMLETTVAARRAALAELRAATPAGTARRTALQTALAHTAHEFHGLGIEMGQRYGDSGAVHVADEPAAYAVVPPGHPAAADPVLYYAPSTYPGVRLPHVWLNRAVPAQAPTSTIDLAGHGKFVLFTGIGGESWRAAAAAVTAALGAPVDVHAIGFRQDWEDVYYGWAGVRGVDESGAVLVRPDRFVAWRCVEVLPSPEACSAKLLHVMRTVLGWEAKEK